jgi:hypothetical protein
MAGQVTNQKLGKIRPIMDRERPAELDGARCMLFPFVLIASQCGLRSRALFVRYGLGLAREGGTADGEVSSPEAGGGRRTRTDGRPNPQAAARSCSWIE